MDMLRDEKLIAVINAIPQQGQRQYGTDEQLRHLYDAANKLGLYDAADVVRRYMDKEPSRFMSGLNLILGPRRIR